MSTFSVPGTGGAHPGLGPETGEETVHAYYQWVPFVLFLQVRPTLKPTKTVTFIFSLVKPKLLLSCQTVYPGRHVLHSSLPVESL